MIEFGQPFALWAGLSIGLPVFAHMAYQTVTRKHAFPSLRFIGPTNIPRTGRKTPRDWLLLLSRILLFILITILLADPYWTQRNEISDKIAKSQAIIAVDLSPSMGGWNALAEAKVQVKSKLAEGEFDYRVVGFNANEVQLVTLPEKKKNDTIDQLKHTWQKGDAQMFLDKIPDFFEQGIDRKKLVIISDFQSGDWQSVYRNLSDDGIDFELIQVGKNEVGGGRQSNLSIVDARQVPVGQEKIRIWVVVRNWEDKTVEAEVELITGGAIKETNKIELQPLGSKQSQFIIDSGSFSQATVRLKKEDLYPVDNQRSLWLKAPPPRRFGFWFSNENEGDTSQEKDFLRTAVLSSGDSGWNRWKMDQDMADLLRLGEATPELELLFCLGLADWFESEQLSNVLTKFLEGGGVALLTPSEPFSASFGVIKKSGLMDFSFSKMAGGALRNRETFRISALSQSSELASLFSGKASRDLYLTSFYRFGVIKNLRENLKIPLSDRDGRALGVVREFESGGRLVFLPFRVNPQWTDLPLRNSFLPLLMELIGKGVNNGNSRAWPLLEPGENWSGTEIFKADKPGVYRFEDQWIEVIPSLSESSPETISMIELEKALGGTQGALSVVEEANDPEGSGSYSLWLWFAIAASILLIIEMIWSRPVVNNAEKEIADHA